MSDFLLQTLQNDSSPESPAGVFAEDTGDEESNTKAASQTDLCQFYAFCPSGPQVQSVAGDLVGNVIEAMEEKAMRFSQQHMMLLNLLLRGWKIFWQHKPYKLLFLQKGSTRRLKRCSKPFRTWWGNCFPNLLALTAKGIWQWPLPGMLLAK